MNTQGAALKNMIALKIGHFFFKFFNFAYFWLHWFFVAAPGQQAGLLFIAVRGLLIAVASLVAEHGL